MKAWKEASGNTGDILFLSDGNAEFARASGLELDASKNGLGTRLQRFSMIVNDGKVEVLNTESAAGQINDTAAARILELL
jgi:peroxiredoxin